MFVKESTLYFFHNKSSMSLYLKEFKVIENYNKNYLALPILNTNANTGKLTLKAFLCIKRGNLH